MKTQAQISAALLLSFAILGALAGSAVAPRSAHAGDCENNACNLDDGDCEVVLAAYNCDEIQGGCDDDECIKPPFQ